MTKLSNTIAFAGPPGSGKSSLIGVLARQLPGSVVIAMDEFSGPEVLHAGDLRGWLDEGGDFSALNISRFTAALAQLTTTKRGIILVEAPLGRAHLESSSLIDRLFWLDVPLDIALARNVLAFQNAPEPPSAAWMQGYLHEYLAVTRAVLAHQEKIVRSGADSILDACLPVDHLARQVIEQIRP